MVRRTVARALAVVAVTFVAGILVATQAPALLIAHVNVVSVADGRLLQDSTVTISGDTITSIAPTGTLPRDVRVVDGEGRFLIPGLWDMHAHTEATGESWLQLYVANGVTGIRRYGFCVGHDSALARRDWQPAGCSALAFSRQDRFSMTRRRLAVQNARQDRRGRQGRGATAQAPGRGFDQGP